jgi:hypothetical protein
MFILVTPGESDNSELQKRKIPDASAFVDRFQRAKERASIPK